MLLFHYFPLILILCIFQSRSQQQIKSYRPFRRQRASSSNLNLNQCTYGGGVINNSTVIELGNCFGDFYFIGLNLGTGPQYFNFQFDTGISFYNSGSPILWIPLGSNPSGFNQLNSNTYQITNQTQSLTYADGTGVGGNMGYDIVSVTGTPINANGSILFAVNSSVTFDNTSVYGLVGMDYTSTPNFLDNAYANGQISTPIFALDINYANQTSYLYYNGISQTILSKTYWINMYGTNHWQLEIIGFSVAGIDMTSSAADTAVVDSGTSLLVLNSDIYTAIIQQYFSTSQCYVDNFGYTNCYCNGTWPTLAFMFIGAEVYVQGNAYQNPVANGFCQVEIQTLSTTGGLIILGDTFLRGYTVSFDRMNTRIGFQGKITPVYVFNFLYFNLIQYILCGLGAILAIIGIVLWNYDRSQLKNKIERNLGVELLTMR